MNNQKKPEVIVQANIENLKGSYTNAVKVVVTNGESFIDFAFMYPDEDNIKRGILNSRIIMSHDLARKLSNSISDALSKYEAKKQKK